MGREQRPGCRSHRRRRQRCGREQDRLSAADPLPCRPRWRCPELLARIPVGTFIDHGPDSPTDPSTKKAYPAYQQLLANGHYGHITPKPGDTLPIPGIKAVVISSNGELLNHALPGAGQPNAYCKDSETRPEDQTDNARSLGTLFTFGKTRILDLGDLTWDKEMQLMCPANKVGKVDISGGLASRVIPELEPRAGGCHCAAHRDHEQRGQEGRLHANLCDPRQSTGPGDALAASFLGRGRHPQHRSASTSPILPGRMRLTT